MTMISDTATLAEACARLADEPYLCVDTEFIREKTYWPLLCLVQFGGPDGNDVAVDPLAEGIDLAPLLALLDKPDLVKVFHAARQDIEIFFHMTGRIPEPLFDTQVAAMVCGFGEAASYETLARKLAGAKVDKSSRFTDWAKRPLSERQLTYALGDVAHLPKIYTKLLRRLRDTGRGAWVDEEMAVLTDPMTYDIHPERAWRRLKTRNTKPRALAVLRAVVAVRESWAQEKDLPRQRLVRDEALMEIAAHAPDTAEALAQTRGLSSGAAHGRLGQALLEAVAAGLAVPDADCPRPAKPPQPARGVGPLVDLLKVLLKMRCEEHDVAQKLVATAAQLERLAADGEDADGVAALHGWRRDIFGGDALALRDGRLALTVRGGRTDVIELTGGTEGAAPTRARTG